MTECCSSPERCTQWRSGFWGMPSAPALPVACRGEGALLPCPWDALPFLPKCHLTFEEEPRRLAGTPGPRLGAPLQERTGTPPHLTGSFDIASLLGKSTSQENKFLSLKCKAKESFTVFRTNIRRGNNSGLYSCLAHCFGFHFPFSSQMSCFSR